MTLPPPSLSAQILLRAISRLVSHPLAKFITFRCSAPAFESFMDCFVRVHRHKRDTRPARQHFHMPRHGLAAVVSWLRASAPQTLSFLLAQSARKRQASGIHSMIITEWPNQSPEPTAVGVVSSAIAVHATSRRWLSFFR